MNRTASGTRRSSASRKRAVAVPDGWPVARIRASPGSIARVRSWARSAEPADYDMPVLSHDQTRVAVEICDPTDAAQRHLGPRQRAGHLDPPDLRSRGDSSLRGGRPTTGRSTSRRFARARATSTRSRAREPERPSWCTAEKARICSRASRPTVRRVGSCSTTPRRNGPRHLPDRSRESGSRGRPGDAASRRVLPAISPDGRWLLYHSDESGRAEVYVQSLRDDGGKWQISNTAARSGAVDARRKGDRLPGPGRGAHGRRGHPRASLLRRDSRSPLRSGPAEVGGLSST